MAIGKRQASLPARDGISIWRKFFSLAPPPLDRLDRQAALLLCRVPPVEQIPRCFPQTPWEIVLGRVQMISARARLIGTDPMPKPPDLV